MKTERARTIILSIVLCISLALGYCEDSQASPAGAPNGGDNFGALYAEVANLSGDAAYDFFMSLKDKGLTDDQILRFFIDLPLSHANEQAASIYENDGLVGFTQLYPYGATVNEYVWEIGEGTDFIGPLTGASGKLPFTNYIPAPEATIGGPKKEYVFGYVGGGSMAPWAAALWDAVVWQGNRFKNLTLLAQQHDGDDSKMSSIVDTMIARRVDVLIIHPRGEAATKPCVQRALNAGIPVVVLDKMSGAPDVNVQVAGNYPANGAQLGMFLVNQLKEEGGIKGNIVFLRKPLGGTDDGLRGGHFLKVISYFPGIKILQSYHDNNNRADAFNNVQASLQAYPEIDAFVAEGDHQGLAAVEAINLAGRMHSRSEGKKIFIINCDDSKEVLSMLENGNVDGIAPYTPHTGDVGVRAAVMLMEGREVPKNVVLPNLPIITRDGKTLFGMKTLTLDMWGEYTFGAEVSRNK
jgi:ribose transport system substrate-binding protein